MCCFILAKRPGPPQVLMGEFLSKDNIEGQEEETTRKLSGSSIFLKQTVGELQRGKIVAFLITQWGAFTTRWLYWSRMKS